MIRRAAKTDANQKRIVRVLRQAGCRVCSTAAVGNGFPDLLVYRPAIGHLFLLEVKDGEKSPSHRKLTPHQAKFHEEWPVHVVKSEDDALKVVGIHGYDDDIDYPSS